MLPDLQGGDILTRHYYALDHVRPTADGRWDADDPGDEVAVGIVRRWNNEPQHAPTVADWQRRRDEVTHATH